MQMLPDQLGFAIVDEVDSILIDESRNPMIISQPRGDNGQLVVTVEKVSEAKKHCAAAAAAAASDAVAAVLPVLGWAC